MKTQAALACIALACLLPSCLSAQSGRAKKPAFAIDAGTIEIPDLIDRCAIYLQWNILWDDNEIQQAKPVRLQMPISTDDDGCHELLCNLLLRSGFALTVLDDSKKMYEVLFVNGQRGREIMGRAQQRSVAEALARPKLKMPIMTTVPLEHVNGQIAANALRPFFASYGNNGPLNLTIGNVGTSKSIILAGFQDQVAQAIRLIEACDVAQPEALYQNPQQLPEYVAKLEQRLLDIEQQLAKLRGKDTKSGDK